MEVPRRNQVTEEPPVEMGSSCGFFAYRPRCLQIFNCMRSFMGFFTALLIVYGMASSYTSSVIPSIEKRFGFSSKSMGIILAVNDAGIVVMALITAHFAGRGHRPRGMFLGSCLCGFALLLIAAPEALFPIDAQSVLGKTIEPDATTQLCDLSTGNATTLKPHNATVCAMEAEGNLGALVVLAVAEFFLGVGSTTLMILGLPFIDDNCPLDDAPVYFAVSFFGRIFGPMLGFGLGAVCNNIFLDGSKPNFRQTDPRWISAWYLGFIVTGGAVLLFATVIGFFPAQISNGRQTQEQFDESAKKAEADSSSSSSEATSQAACDSSVTCREFIVNLQRLFTNLPFMCRAWSSCLDGMIITGFLSFFFKFIAQQYQISPAVASLSGGVPTIFGIALGVVGGGLLIKKYHLQPRHVGLMLVVTAGLLCVVFLVNIALGCERTEVLGLPGSESLHKMYEGYSVSFNNSYCSASLSCGCQEDFRPVCDPKSGVNFYSPCHAGCGSSRLHHDIEYFDNCTCVKNSVWFYDDVDNDSLNGRMIGGFCPKRCPNIYAFVCIMFIAMFCMGLPLAGSIMIQYRLVDPDLKAMSTGLLLLITSAFGYLPAPIFVGAIVDSTCRLWQTSSCGEKKFCLLYDTDEFRWKFLITAVCIKAVGGVLDAVVTIKMWNMLFDRTTEEPALPASKPNPFPSASSLSPSMSFSSPSLPSNVTVSPDSFGTPSVVSQTRPPFLHEISESRL
ncbi:Solute carrier organic anion transporter family member 4C1 [Hypsibius exemplaris]|uniref:Solute carrier organic anion transporter family member n=1 Tax=Hypsibius exemplaris TaxID=2072580 RepID=A0A1W0WJQ5_HYPEX|nr:Solute carrier organic anion transporter family member 4C1 [Hypsibius exemplaris]